MKIKRCKDYSCQKELSEVEEGVWQCQCGIIYKDDKAFKKGLEIDPNI